MRAEHEREYTEYASHGLARLQKMAYVLCGEPHSAADLVQETLVTLYVHWPRIRMVEHLDGYVRKILLNRFLQERRRPWRRMRLTASVPETPVGGPAAPAEDRAELVAALRLVPARQRAVLALRYLYDLPVDEVAELLGCSSGTVKSQAARGLATLRRLLDVPAGATAPSAAGGRDGH